MIYMERERISQLLDKLINSESFEFPDYRQPLHAPKEQGVYIILDSQETVVHVGSTPRAKYGIYQRLKNHLSGSSSFKYHYLNGDGYKLRKSYKYRFIVVENPRERCLLEAYAIGFLCPKHLGVG